MISFCSILTFQNRLRVRKTALNQLIKRRFAFVGVWPVNI